MSLNIIKRNSSSPFHLQRSIVSQSGEGGAYEEGGYNPELVYNDSGISAGVAAFGKVIGAGLSSLSDEDKNEIDKNKKVSLENREKKISDKMQTGDISDKKIERLGNRLERVDDRKKETELRIDTYNKKNKLSITATQVNENDKRKKDWRKIYF